MGNGLFRAHELVDEYGFLSGNSQVIEGVAQVKMFHGSGAGDECNPTFFFGVSLFTRTDSFQKPYDEDSTIRRINSIVFLVMPCSSMTAQKGISSSVFPSSNPLPSVLMNSRVLARNWKELL